MILSPSYPYGQFIMYFQSIGLFLNAEKTKYIHLNPSSEFIRGGQQVEKVNEFLYLEGYANITYGVETRIGKFWMHYLHSPYQKSGSHQLEGRLIMRLFKASVESILFYTVQILGH